MISVLHETNEWVVIDLVPDSGGMANGKKEGQAVPVVCELYLILKLMLPHLLKTALTFQWAQSSSIKKKI